MQIRKLMMILGGVLVGVASLIPLTSYADDESTKAPCTTDDSGKITCTDDKNANVTVNVQTTLTLDVAPEDLNFTANVGNISEGNIAATVTSNQAYNLSVNSPEPNMYRYDDDKQPITTPSNSFIPANGIVNPGQLGWGIKLAGNQTSKCVATEASKDNKYIAVPKVKESTTICSSTTGANAEKTTFTVGIGTTSALETGTYQTDLIFTASTSGATNS